MPEAPRRWRAMAVNIPHFLESLAVTLACCLLQSVALLGLRLDSWMHETANFLRHYEAASLQARLPVNLVIMILFSLNLIVVCIARRRTGGDLDD